MWKLLIFWGVLCCSLMLVNCSGDTGPGQYNILYIDKCGKDDDAMQFDINRKRINRTHDGFNAHLNIKRSLSDDSGMRAHLFRKMDGGYKLQQEFLEPSLPSFLYKYAKNNTKRCIKMAGIDPPDFPIPPGEYDIENFILDYHELSLDGIYGEYSAKINIMDGLRVISCIEAQFEFKKNDDDDAD